MWTKTSRAEFLMRRNQAITAVFALGLSSVTAPAAAQEFGAFDRITDRHRPEYATTPIYVGGFAVAPSIEAGLEYIGNVYVSDAIQADDVALVVRPRATITDRREDREIRLDLSTGIQKFLGDKAADRLQAAAVGRARFGIGAQMRPYVNLDIRVNDTSGMSLIESGNVAEPIRLFSVGGTAGFDRDFGPFVATVEGRYKTTDYDGDTIVGGIRFDSGFRNYDIYGVRGRLAYSVNPAQRIYAQLQFDRYDYDSSGTVLDGPGPFFSDRSADNVNISVGYERQITELLQADVNVGYMAQNFDSSDRDTLKAFSFRGTLYYSPTPLTNFRLQAVRSVDDTINPLFSSLLRTELAFNVEHELRRDLVLTADGRVSDFSGGDNAVSGNEYQVSAMAKYYMSPNWSTSVRAEYFERSGLFDGSQSRLMIRAAYDF